MKILAVETSCDETAIALVEAKGGLKKPRFKIIKNFVASQIKVHRPFGGIVPNLAKREHLKNLPILLNKILKTNSYKPKANIDLIAVTVGPGLEPALWTGINFAKELYKKFKIQNSPPKADQPQAEKFKIIGVSHLDGHLYSFLLNKKTANSKFKIQNLKFPAVALLVSGGHTILFLMKDLTHYKKLGETRDDAVGEAFDKVARLLKLSYPGGPEIEKLAKKGNPAAIHFPRPMLNQKNYDFSFSGLKTAVLYYIRDKISFAAADVATAFQSAAFEVLIFKAMRAVQEYGAKSIFISGGVAANKTLRKEFRANVKSQMSKVKFFAPPKFLCTDNAAMIAAAGYINYLKGKKRRLTASGNLSI